MSARDYPKMTEDEIIKEIGSLEEGQAVAFVVKSQDREKTGFTYEVDEVRTDSTVYVAGPQGGEWQFTLKDGRPYLQFNRPSSGWTSAGVLDYVEGQ